MAAAEAAAGAGHVGAGHVGADVASEGDAAPPAINAVGAVETTLASVLAELDLSTPIDQKIADVLRQYPHLAISLSKATPGKDMKTLVINGKKENVKLVGGVRACCHHLLFVCCFF